MSRWTRRIPPEEAARRLQRAIAEGRLDTEPPALIAHDLGLMEDRLDELKRAFPPGTLHTVAIKANPLLVVLERLVAAGAGLEAASSGEIELALAAGCPPDRLVFDSPAKTDAELNRALELGIRLNADNLAELSRIEARLRDRPSASRIGLRLNPMVGPGAIASTSVADAGSKFGVPIVQESAIFEAFRQYPCLTGLHLHVGSQGCEMAMLVEAAKRVWALAERLDAAFGPHRILTLDLGGGLPTAYRPDDTPPDIRAYALALKEAIPGAFVLGVELITEFGRALQANCGWAASRVEYVKGTPDSPIAVVHLGADLLVRRAYRPEDWFHELAVCDAAGRLKDPMPTGRWAVAGPLCFSGDLLAREMPLPEIHPGDWLLIRDVGAYTLGMWSRYCSRPIPQVLGYSELDGPWVVLREAETPADVVAFWGPQARSR